MRTGGHNNSNDYVFDKYTYDKNENLYGRGRGMVWPYGSENWCNMEGQYLHIVSHLSYGDGWWVGAEISLCSLAVYGTKYVRPGDPLPDRVFVAQNSIKDLDVIKIIS